jgi:rare lipoprotein A
MTWSCVSRPFRPLLLIGVLFLASCTALVPPPSPAPQTPPAPAPGSAAPPGVPRPYRVDGQWYQPIPDARGFREQGVASWYGEPFHGRRTSNGETYDMYGISAAHKTLPFGTMVRVRNLANQRYLEVRINDRGPFVHGRIIDLSYGAARQLEVVGPGTAPVEVVALATPVAAGAGGVAAPQEVDLTRGDFTFQVGAFRERGNAERLAQKLESRYAHVHIAAFDRGDGLFHRVRVGRVSSLAEADAFEQGLIREGFNVFIVAE